MAIYDLDRSNRIEYRILEGTFFLCETELFAAGGGGEAHRLQDVRLHRGGEGRLDQVYPVSRRSASGQTVALESHYLHLLPF